MPVNVINLLGLLWPRVYKLLGFSAVYFGKARMKLNSCEFRYSKVFVAGAILN